MRNMISWKKTYEKHRRSLGLQTNPSSPRKRPHPSHGLRNRSYGAISFIDPLMLRKNYIRLRLVLPSIARNCGVGEDDKYSSGESKSASPMDLDRPYAHYTTCLRTGVESLYPKYQEPHLIPFQSFVQIGFMNKFSGCLGACYQKKYAQMSVRRRPTSQQFTHRIVERSYTTKSFHPSKSIKDN